MFKKSTFLFLMVTVCVFSCKKDYIAAPSNEVSKKETEKSSAPKFKGIIVRWNKGEQNEKVISRGGKFSKTVFTRAMKRFGDIGFDVYDMPEDKVLSAIAELRKDPSVKSVCPNYIVSHQDFPTPNDSLYVVGQLWDVKDIGADKVWPKNSGSRNIVIDLIDEGTAWWTPDAQGNLDAEHSYDFLRRSSALGEGAIFSNSPGHANATYSQIAAKGYNGSGRIGISPYSRVISTKFLEGSGALSDAIAAMDYTVSLKLDSGINIKVSSNSWGYQGDSTTIMGEAIGRFEQADILFVAAAGNAATNNDVVGFYPASHKYPNVISVAAKDVNDNLASFSNYGATTVHLGAPGVTVPCLKINQNGDQDVWYPSGTSMATPEVAAAAALYFAWRPNDTYQQCKDFLLAHVRPLPSLVGKTITGGTLYVGDIGAAVLDTGAAMKIYPKPFYDGTPPTAATNVHSTAVTDNSVTLDWTDGSDPESGIYFHGIVIHWDGVPNAQVSTFNHPITISGLPSGTAVTFTVYEINHFNLLSPPSSPYTVTTTGSHDTTGPSKPQNLKILTETQTSANYVWDESIDAAMVNSQAMGHVKILTAGEPLKWLPPKDSYKQISVLTASGVYYYEVQAANLKHTTTVAGTDNVNWINLAGFPVNDTFWLSVRAVDRAGNYSAWADSVYKYTTTPVTPPPSDTIPPTIPTGLTASATSTTLTLNWNPSSDNTGVIGYYVRLNTGPPFFVGSLSHTWYNLTPNTSYTLWVAASDAAGNLSNYTPKGATTLPDGTPPPTKPVINSFSASPSTIDSGSVSTLSWNITGATTISIDNGVGVVTGSSISVSPNQTTTYTITATNSAGSVTAQTTVTVNKPQPPPPISPVINLFVANPASIQAGRSSTISWDVSNATSVTLNGVVVSSFGSQIVSPIISTTYTLIATNSGGSVLKDITITVKQHGRGKPH